MTRRSGVLDLGAECILSSIGLWTQRGVTTVRKDVGLPWTVSMITLGRGDSEKSEHRIVPGGTTRAEAMPFLGHMHVFLSLQREKKGAKLIQFEERTQSRKKMFKKKMAINHHSRHRTVIQLGEWHDSIVEYIHLTKAVSKLGEWHDSIVEKLSSNTDSRHLLDFRRRTDVGGDLTDR